MPFDLLFIFDSVCYLSFIFDVFILPLEFTEEEISENVMCNESQFMSPCFHSFLFVGREKLVKSKHLPMSFCSAYESICSRNDPSFSREKKMEVV